MSDPIDSIKAVSHRNHIVSLEELADQFAGENEKLREILVKFGETLLLQTSWAYSKACASAVAQCSGLIRDPQYYATKRQRAAKERQRTIERKREQIERELIESADPEAMAQKAEMRINALRMSAAYHEGEARMARRKEAEMLGMGDED